MRKRTLVILIATTLVLCFAGEAGAARHKRTAHAARLTMADVHRAIRAYTAPDHPSSVTHQCAARFVPQRVSCSVTEHGFTLGTDNGEPMVGDVSYRVTITLRDKRVHLVSSLFSETVTLPAS